MNIKMNNTDYVIYVIINDSLNMSKGKITAQTFHAANILKGYFEKTYPKNILDDYEKWFKNNERTIALRAKESKLLNIIEEFKDCYVVIDSGYTEVLPGSKTIVVLQPMLRTSNKAKFLKRLQCL